MESVFILFFMLGLIQTAEWTNNSSPNPSGYVQGDLIDQGFFSSRTSRADSISEIFGQLSVSNSRGTSFDNPQPQMSRPRHHTHTTTYIPQQQSSPVNDHAQSTAATSISPAISTSSHPSPVATSQSESLYVPFKCRDYRRMWDFYACKPEDISITEPIAWVSRSGFAANVIKELELSTGVTDSYTIVSHYLFNPAKLYQRLIASDYLEIKCPSDRIFYHICFVSESVDKFLKSKIIAINISYLNETTASVKIIFDRDLGTFSHEAIYKQLKLLNPYVESFQPYQF